MTDWYAPNQQAVRADESGPAEEGTGGTPAEPSGDGGDGGDGPSADELDAMTKAQLLDVAGELGIQGPNEDWLKGDIRAEIDEALGR